MDSEKKLQITSALSERGDQSAKDHDQILRLVQEELLEIARGLLQRERHGHSFSAGDLVNELWLRLYRGAPVDEKDHHHFRRIAARGMRRILVDHARTSNAAKRPPPAKRLGLSDAWNVEGGGGEIDLERVDTLLSELACIEPRAAQVVDLVVFGGLDVETVAENLGVSARTVRRDLDVARDWMREHL